MKRLILLMFILCFVVSSFSQTKGTFIDTRDGKIYKTIQIGTQTWLAENLAFKPDEGNFWAYENDQATVSQYGFLYDYETAKNACPSGWKLPSEAEFRILLDNWGSEPNDCFSALISNGNSGFSALLGGAFAVNKFYNKGEIGIFWSSSVEDINSAYALTFKKTYLKEVDMWFNGTVLMGWKKIAGVSVRCIKD